MQKIHKLSLFIVCLLLVVSSTLLFVGCGKKNDNEIRLNEVTHSIFYAPLYVALNNGYFEDEGLEVTLESATGSDASMTALISDSADIVLIGPEQVVYSESLKDRPVIFGQLTQKDGSFFVGQEDDDNFTLDDLKGKTIIGGRQGGFPAMTLEYIIKQAGLTIGTNASAGEVNLRTDVSFPMIASEFITSGNEYCTLFEPNATTLENEGNGYVLKAVGDFSGYIPYTCFVAKTSYLEKKGDKAEKFLKAVKRGYEYLKTATPENAAKALAKSFSGMTNAELAIAVSQYIAIDAWCSDLILTESAFNNMLNVLNGASATPYSPVYANIVNNTFAQNLVEA